MTDFNVRGGAEQRKIYAKIKKAKKSLYVCPKSGKKLKRISNSIWESYAGYIYAGGAYTFSTPNGEVFDRMLKEYKAKQEQKK
jgi:ribosomal protein L37AE/L43A